MDEEPLRNAKESLDLVFELTFLTSSTHNLIATQFLSELGFNPEALSALVKKSS
ncbi:unnamed protein product [Amaranthus hypochondriacus]